jgi:hypothetical protein
MSAPEGPAAPASGTSPDVPSFASLAADPEIAALLDFEPVPRSHAKANGWTPDMQRMFIAWLAYYGSPTNACDELGKARSGIDKVYKSPEADSFRTSWDAAVALAEKRRIATMATSRGGLGAMRAPAMSRRLAESIDAAPLPGQVMNEYGEWEDEASLQRRAEEARDSISNKLLNARRLYLREISACPGKRAAFEILTELPIDWDKARRLEPQPDEPWNRANQRQPDMILTAESGWSFGEHGYGEDKKKALLEAINQHLIEEGQEPVDWSQEDAEQVRDRGGETKMTAKDNSLRAGAATSQDKPEPRVRRV